MKITSVNLKNFQAHKDTVVNFHSGLNVIKGVNWSNKSGIVRAIKWVILNRPRGDAFKSHFAENHHPVSVSITFDNSLTVTRERKGRENLYRIEFDGKVDEYKALGVDVPDEVRAVLQMDSINVQSQGDPYFMLGENPGTRAKELNKVVGLEIIDRSNKMANSLYNEKKSLTKALASEIKKTKEKAGSFEDLEARDLQVKKIAKLLDDLKETEKEFEDLVYIYHELDQAQDILQTTIDWLEIEKDFNPIAEKYQILKEKKWRHFQINEDVKDIRFNLNCVEDAKEFLECEKEISTIESLSSKLQKLKKKRISIMEIINSIIFQQDILQDANDDLIKISKEMNKIKICPTCGQKVNGWK